MSRTELKQDALRVDWAALDEGDGFADVMRALIDNEAEQGGLKAALADVFPSEEAVASSKRRRAYFLIAIIATAAVAVALSVSWSIYGGRTDPRFTNRDPFKNVFDYPQATLSHRIAYKGFSDALFLAGENSLPMLRERLYAIAGDKFISEGPRAAKTFLDKVAETHGEWSDWNYFYGCVVGNPKEAFEQFQKAIKTASSNDKRTHLAYNNLALSYVERWEDDGDLRSLKTAKSLIDKGIELCQTDDRLHATRATILERFLAAEQYEATGSREELVRALRTSYLDGMAVAVVDSRRDSFRRRLENMEQ